MTTPIDPKFPRAVAHAIGCPEQLTEGEHFCDLKARHPAAVCYCAEAAKAVLGLAEWHCHWCGVNNPATAESCEHCNGN